MLKSTATGACCQHMRELLVKLAKEIEFITVLGQCIGGNAMEFELLADSIKQINDKASSAAKSAVNQL